MTGNKVPYKLQGRYSIMSHEDFNRYLDDQLQRIVRILSDKSKEYASDNDTYHVFVVAGDIDNETPERALWGMLKKHIVSVRDLVQNIERSRDALLSDDTLALWQEKCGDMINYTLLLLGMAYARRVKGPATASGAAQQKP